MLVGPVSLGLSVRSLRLLRLTLTALLDLPDSLVRYSGTCSSLCSPVDRSWASWQCRASCPWSSSPCSRYCLIALPHGLALPALGGTVKRLVVHSLALALASVRSLCLHCLLYATTPCSASMLAIADSASGTVPRSGYRLALALACLHGIALDLWNR